MGRLIVSPCLWTVNFVCGWVSLVEERACAAHPKTTDFRSTISHRRNSVKVLCKIKPSSHQTMTHLHNSVTSFQSEWFLFIRPLSATLSLWICLLYLIWTSIASQVNHFFVASICILLGTYFVAATDGGTAGGGIISRNMRNFWASGSGWKEAKTTKKMWQHTALWSEDWKNLWETGLQPHSQRPSISSILLCREMRTQRVWYIDAPLQVTSISLAYYDSSDLMRCRFDERITINLNWKTVSFSLK